MAHTGNSDKSNQFNEFFSIQSNFNVNINFVDTKQNTSFDNFIQQIPTPFKMAGDINSIDNSALKPLQALSGVANQLVEYLNYQNKKIDLLLTYILNQEDNEHSRFQGIAFGGGGIIFSSEQSLELGQLLAVKIFLLTENCAVYCHGEVIEIDKAVLNSQQEHQQTEGVIKAYYHHKVVFHHIRDEDRES